jgi:hypothetical protein
LDLTFICGKQVISSSQNVFIAFKIKNKRDGTEWSEKAEEEHSGEGGMMR